jgi:hypothetical protein
MKTLCALLAVLSLALIPACKKDKNQVDEKATSGETASPPAAGQKPGEPADPAATQPVPPAEGGGAAMAQPAAATSEGGAAQPAAAGEGGAAKKKEGGAGAKKEEGGW